MVKASTPTPENLAETFRQTRYTNRIYKNPTPGTLSLAAFRPFQDGAAPTDRLWIALYDAGINTSVIGPKGEQVLTAIEEAHSNGISTILIEDCLVPGLSSSEGQRLSECTTLVRSLRNTKGLKGYVVGAIPCPQGLPALQATAEAVSGADSEKCIMTVLAPKGSFEGENSDHYLRYVAGMQEYLLPGLWVVDSSGALNGSSDSGAEWKRKFLNTMEMYSLLSRYTSRPFWTTVKATATSDVSSGGKVGNIGRVLYQALVALAYGAQGLLFSDSEAGIDTISAVIGRIRTMETLFLGTQVIQTVHVGPADASSSRPDEAPPLTDELGNGEILYTQMRNPVGPLTGISYPGPGVLVSHICRLPDTDTGQAEDFLVIVNHDRDEAQNVSLTFSSYYKVEEVRSARLNAEIVTQPVGITENNPTVSRTIAPGDCLVFRWR